MLSYTESCSGLGWVLTQEERNLRHTKRTKNKKTSQNAAIAAPKVNQVCVIASSSPPSISRRLICPIMPGDLQQIALRQKQFVQLQCDNSYKYFATRPQVIFLRLIKNFLL